MNFKDCEKDLNVGQMVWICDFRLNPTKGADKPIRHIKPTHVEIVSNNELPKGKIVYYSEVHFRPINKNGKRLSKIIPPYDNTGYRSFTGEALNVFTRKEECIEFYKNQCDKAIDILENEKQERINFYTDKISEIRGLYRDY